MILTTGISWPPRVWEVGGVSDLPQPIDVLPHRDPFLLVSEVTELTPGERAKGLWRLTGDEAFWAGHFPGRPTLPGVLMVEALAQVGAVALLTDERFTGKLPLFGGIEKARFRRQVVPGEVLELEVTLYQLSGVAGKGKGVATVDGDKACQADLLFVLARSG